MEFTFGVDPEFFLLDKMSNKHVPAVGFVPGTKEKPYPIKGGAVQLDGTAVEFNTNPAKNADEFVENVNFVLNDIRKMISSQYNFSFKPSVVYDKITWDKTPESAKELGCTPDYNAYNGGEPNPTPDNKTLMRTGAGHLHIGFTKGADVKSHDHMWDCCMLTKKLDGIFQEFSPLWDTDKDREKLYGARGAFRPKPYGVEYRVLSNAWLQYPKIWKWLWQVSDFALKELEKGRIYSNHSGGILKYNYPYYNQGKTDVQYLNLHFKQAYQGKFPAFPENYKE